MTAGSLPMPDLLVICGPTASGKTWIGVQLALRLHGEILSVDSRQVYRGLDLGAGKDLDEYRTAHEQVACHLIDIADPRQVYSLWHFVRDFGNALTAVRARGRLPVAVGGTGLYLEAVLRGYRIPSPPPDDRLRRQLMEQPLERLVEQLRQLRLDPAYHHPALDRVDVSSKRRVVRALEIGLKQAAGAESPPVQAQPGQPLVVAIRWDRTRLLERIAIRLDERLRAGMIDEVRTLMHQGVPSSRLRQLGMEYRHVARYLDGETTLECMTNDLRRDIARLAKRQQTWFRGMERRGVPMHWVDGDPPDRAVEHIEQLFLAARHARE